MPNNYNGIAKFYDALSYTIYQRSIVKAQQFLIEFIDSNDMVLLVGGGTGWILEEISKLNKQNVSVVYVEKSSAMIELAKKRKFENIKAEFINAAIEDYTSELLFDIIFTPFLFDNFLEEKIRVVFSKLNLLLNKNGIWLYADFMNDKTNSKAWQQMLLKTMYLFFKITTGIEAKELIDMRPYFEKEYQLLTQQFFYSHFIQAIAYRKR